MDNLIGELDLFQKEHEAKQLQQHQKLLNGHVINNYNNSCSEYQTPNPITATSNTIITQQNSLNNNNIHNDSFISTSTTITGTYSHHAFNGTAIASDDSEIKSASLNYSITSNASMTTTLSDLQKFNCSDFTENKSPYNDHDLSSETGFENPSFRHLNDTSSSSSSNIVLIRDDDLPPSYYSRNSTDTVVVLRSKMGSNNNSMTDLSQIDTPTFEQKMQRLSSFKFDNNNFSIATPNGSPSHYYSALNNNNNNNSSSSPSIPSISKGSLSSHGSFGALMYGQIEDDTDTKNAAALTSTSNNFNVNNNVNVVTTASNVKPTLAPRPASLLSGIFK